MPLPTLTPIGSDSFNRANENPLNSTNWATIPSVPALQIVSNKCEGTNTLAALTGELFKASAPNDQYVQATIAALPGGSEAIYILCRATWPNQNGQAGYAVQPEPTAQILYNLTQTPQQIGNFAGAGNVNDVFVLAAIDTTLTVLQNGSQIISATDSTYSSGSTALAVTVTTLADAAFTNFVMGSASSAPVITGSSGNHSVSAGQTATFSVTASGGALSYQWYKNGVAISGATSSSYTTPPETGADNGAQFKVVVSNSLGSVTSAAMVLTVPSSDSIKIKILQQYDPDPHGLNPLDPDTTGTRIPGKIRLHDYTVGSTIILSADVAVPLIANGWAQAV